MASSGFTPISLYYSTTASAAPTAGNLTSGELAINITDGKLFYKDNGGVVQTIATKAGATGTVSSVAQTFTGGLISVSGSPVTTSGTLALTVAGTSGGIPYFSSASAWASSAALAANAIMVGGGAGAAPATVTTGTGVVTALGVNTGSAGSFVVNGGVLGTPSSGTLTNATGLPVSTGISGFGTGVSTALGVNTGSSGAFVVNGGGLGTPSSGTVTNLTGTASININGTVGATTPNTGAFTTLSSTGNTTLGDASADTVTINGTVQPGVVISGSSAGDALRITQTGAGNALLVEDSANPDSTPFVVDANGSVGIGTATPNTALTVYRNGTTSAVSATADGAIANIYSQRSSDDTSGGLLSVRKTRGTSTVPVIVNSGDTIGALNYGAYDGAAIINGAQILAAVDGTPGTNDMPGRLVFSTTADGASTLTERMRIDNAGQVGIGGAPFAGSTLTLAKNMTGATTSYAVFSNGKVQSDVTSSVRNFQSSLTTAAASFTLPTYIHFYAEQSSIGAGSSVTNQYGFLAESNLTGATNNYGFFSNLANAVGAANFVAGGTAANIFVGQTSLGGFIGSESLRATPTASAVNFVQATGGVTGNAVVLSAQGSDSNVSFNLAAKGTGSVLVTTGGLGYGTGTGGAVTQTTSRTTGVTLNNTNGAITLVSAAGSTSFQSFTVTNSTVAATDVIRVCQKSGTDKYAIWVTNVAAGSFQITFATLAGTTTEQPVFNFAVMKAVTS